MPPRPVSPRHLTLLLAALAATSLGAGPPARARALAAPDLADREVARFVRCSDAERVTCVVDGDAFWYRGDKIRIADINSPETGRPACPREAALGAAATMRPTELLNRGAFTLAPAADGRNRDRYGRLLREVTRGGASLGDNLGRRAGRAVAGPARRLVPRLSALAAPPRIAPRAAAP